MPLCNYDLKYELFHATDETYSSYSASIDDYVDFVSLEENDSSVLDGTYAYNGAGKA